MKLIKCPLCMTKVKQEKIVAVSGLCIWCHAAGIYILSEEGYGNKKNK